GTPLADGFNSIHDHNGNLLDDGINQYEYDLENHLIRVIRKADGQPLAEYGYDALGRRVTRTTVLDGVVTHFYYLGNRVIEEQNLAGETQAFYVYGSGVDELFFMDRGGERVFYHQDALGSVVGLTDQAGNWIEEVAYSPYGQVVVLDGDGAVQAGSQVGNPYLFTGRRWDAETGLYHYRTRAYHPERGRYLQRDPLGYADGMNLYQYARSNPVTNSDPSGLLTDWGVFRQYLRHWSFAKGAPFLRYEGEWGEFMRAYPDVKSTAKVKMAAEALRLWRRSNEERGNYQERTSVVINRSYPLKVTLNGVRYILSGRYYINRENCTVHLYENKHVIWDLADPNGWKDYPLRALTFTGHFYGDLPLSPFPTFDYFYTEITWNSDGIIFQLNSAGTAMMPVNHNWPYVR
ncbi:MAG: RHS repeat-associated core domain-containing protein, partial [Anaerolineales bacterium]|nr:RHS repeat-associated core domain-containing protein [Anaerolineales bacterium]